MKNNMNNNSVKPFLGKNEAPNKAIQMAVNASKTRAVSDGVDKLGRGLGRRVTGNGPFLTPYLGQSLGGFSEYLNSFRVSGSQKTDYIDPIAYGTHNNMFQNIDAVLNHHVHVGTSSVNVYNRSRNGLGAYLEAMSIFVMKVLPINLYINEDLTKGTHDFSTFDYTDASASQILASMAADNNSKHHPVQKIIANYALAVKDAIIAQSNDKSMFFLMPAPEIYDRLLDYFITVAYIVITGRNLGHFKHFASQSEKGAALYYELYARDIVSNSGLMSEMATKLNVVGKLLSNVYVEPNTLAAFLPGSLSSYLPNNVGGLRTTLIDSEAINYYLAPLTQAGGTRPEPGYYGEKIITRFPEIISSFHTQATRYLLSGEVRDISASLAGFNQFSTLADVDLDVPNNDPGTTLHDAHSLQFKQFGFSGNIAGFRPIDYHGNTTDGLNFSGRSSTQGTKYNGFNNNLIVSDYRSIPNDELTVFDSAVSQIKSGVLDSFISPKGLTSDHVILMGSTKDPDLVPTLYLRPILVKGDRHNTTFHLGITAELESLEDDVSSFTARRLLPLAACQDVVYPVVSAGVKIAFFGESARYAMNKAQITDPLNMVQKVGGTMNIENGSVVNPHMATTPLKLRGEFWGFTFSNSLVDKGAGVFENTGNYFAYMGNLARYVDRIFVTFGVSISFAHRFVGDTVTLVIWPSGPTAPIPGDYGLDIEAEWPDHYVNGTNFMDKVDIREARYRYQLSLRQVV